MAEHLGWDDIVVGRQATVDFVVTPENMLQFAALSGDLNPLHLDTEFAQKRGFQGQVVYGAMLIAKVSQLIGMKLPGRDSVWSTISMNFHRPLYVNQNAQLMATVVSLSKATKMVEMKITIHAMEKLLAKGKTEVMLVAP